MLSDSHIIGDFALVVGDWLRRLGLEQYERVFRDNDVDAEVLSELTADDLIGLGIASIGHRRKLLTAIAAMHPGPGPAETVLTSQPRADRNEAERRQLTVMFVDMVGSTALSARLDPEELRELLRAYHFAVTAEIERHGGHIAKYLGDGVLAYFGFPRANEDDAERAVRAGLAAAAATAALPPVGNDCLSARVGIATGVVVVGDLIGEGAAREQAVIGDTPNLAARLQSLAEPGSVVIADSTRRLVGQLFECLDLGATPAKGFPEPVRAHCVVRVGAVESRFEAFHAALAPLVGREEQVELLLRRWRQAACGAGCVVLLSGEPGIGKSRLLAAFQEFSIRNRTFACATSARCTAKTARSIRSSRSWSVPPRLGATMRPRRGSPSLRCYSRGRPRTAEDVALLAELLSLPIADRDASLALPPQRKRELTFEALLRQLVNSPAKGPSWRSSRMYIGSIPARASCWTSWRRAS